MSRCARGHARHSPSVTYDRGATNVTATALAIVSSRHAFRRLYAAARLRLPANDCDTEYVPMTLHELRVPRPQIRQLVYIIVQGLP